MDLQVIYKILNDNSGVSLGLLFIITYLKNRFEIKLLKKEQENEKQLNKDENKRIENMVTGFMKEVSESIRYERQFSNTMNSGFDKKLQRIFDIILDMSGARNEKNND